jgi:hypothetical protein
VYGLRSALLDQVRLCWYYCSGDGQIIDCPHIRSFCFSRNSINNLAWIHIIIRSIHSSCNSVSKLNIVKPGIFLGTNHLHCTIELHLTRTIPLNSAVAVGDRHKPSLCGFETILVPREQLYCSTILPKPHPSPARMAAVIRAKVGFGIGKLSYS